MSRHYAIAPAKFQLVKDAFTAADIQRYYDAHTATFVRRGQGGELGAIHRAVWGPGVRDRRAAFHHLDDRIADRVARLPFAMSDVHVVDLGCGVGGSVCYLAARWPWRVTGVTLSAVQAEEARRRVRAAGLDGRVSIVEGDYCALPPGIGRAHVAYAIESFVHGPSPERFFAESYALLEPGGLLVMYDDVLRAMPTRRAAATVARFRHGWHINTLLHRDTLVATAARAGFALVDAVDLTAYLELGRPRDRMIALATAVVRHVPALAQAYAPLVGGAALQTALARGWIGFDEIVLQRLG